MIVGLFNALLFAVMLHNLRFSPESLEYREISHLFHLEDIFECSSEKSFVYVIFM